MLGFIDGRWPARVMRGHVRQTRKGSALLPAKPVRWLRRVTRCEIAELFSEYLQRLDVDQRATGHLCPDWERGAKTARLWQSSMQKRNAMTALGASGGQDA